MSSIVHQEPNIFEIRDRIDSIKIKRVRLCDKFIYLIDGRVSEAVSVAAPSDTGTTPRGPMARSLSFQEYEGDEVALFTVKTAKRDGRERICALPISKEYEPWTKDVVDYFSEFDPTEYVFPFNRQNALRNSKPYWDDLWYKIEPYNVIEVDAAGNVLLDKDNKKIRRRIDTHYRTFTIHAVRHIRASDLVVFYGFVGKDLSAFAGWTLSTAMGISSSVDRYVQLDWRGYFPKLLKKRYS